MVLYPRPSCRDDAAVGDGGDPYCKAEIIDSVLQWWLTMFIILNHQVKKFCPKRQSTWGSATSAATATSTRIPSTQQQEQQGDDDEGLLCATVCVTCNSAQIVHLLCKWCMEHLQLSKCCPCE